MFTFTVGGRGRGVYTKLRIVNEVKSYVTYLISNSSADIFFFSNIEIGSELHNPHLHTQIWSDDKNAVKKIYNAVIKKFDLNEKRSCLSYPQKSMLVHTSKPIKQALSPENTSENHTKTPTLVHPKEQALFSVPYYDYIIKDYSKKLSDDEVWKLEETKKRMRKTLGLKVRFFSKSKGKYTSKMYKIVYRAFRVLRASADKFLDFVTSSLFFKMVDLELLLYARKCVVLSYNSFFKSIIEQERVFMCDMFMLYSSFAWWIYGKT